MVLMGMGFALLSDDTAQDAEASRAKGIECLQQAKAIAQKRCVEATPCLQPCLQHAPNLIKTHCGHRGEQAQVVFVDQMLKSKASVSKKPETASAPLPKDSKTVPKTPNQDSKSQQKSQQKSKQKSQQKSQQKADSAVYSAMAKALVARDVAILFLKGAWAASFIIYMSLNVPLVNLTHIRARTGTPSHPQCIHSKRAVENLDQAGLRFDSYDVLAAAPALQGAVKDLSDFRLFPQLYIKGTPIYYFLILPAVQRTNPAHSNPGPPLPRQAGCLAAAT